MTHVRTLIHDSLDQELASAEQAKVDAHLRSCEPCRAEFAELRRNDALLAKREPLAPAPPRRVGRPSARFRVAPALATAVLLVVAVLVGSSLGDLRRGAAAPAAAADFRPFVMTIEEWDAQRANRSDGTHLAGTSRYLLEYTDRRNWTLRLVSDEVPGSDYVQIPGQGSACRDGVSGHIDPQGAFQPTSTDPTLCNGVGRWIHYGMAENHSWTKQVSGNEITYTSPGERVVFERSTGLPLLYEAGAVGGEVTHRETFRVERSVAVNDPRSRPSVTGICAAARQHGLDMNGPGQHVEKVAVKRMSLQDLSDGSAGQFRLPLRTEDASSTFLCVTAVSGELRQPGGLIDMGTFRWAVFASLAGSADPLGTQYGNDGAWPTYFDALADRRGEPYPGTLVELVDPQTIRVRLESGKLSEAYGNPVLLRADKFTEITPTASSIAGPGVRPGDHVAVWFESSGRSRDGAYALAVFHLAQSASASPRRPDVPRCPAGQLPMLDITQPQPPGDRPGQGSPTATEAFRRAYPSITSYTLYLFGSDQPVSDVRDIRGAGPVWIVAGSDTYIAVAPGYPGANNWYAYPAKFLGCHDAA